MLAEDTRAKIRRVEEDVRNQAKVLKRPRVFLCLDNGKTYLRKPKKCSKVLEQNLEEYVDALIKKRTEKLRKELAIWEWLAKNRLSFEATEVFFVSRSIHFSNGYLLAVGGGLTAYFRTENDAKKHADLLRKLANAPFPVTVFVSSHGYGKHEIKKELCK